MHALIEQALRYAAGGSTSMIHPTYLMLFHDEEILHNIQGFGEQTVGLYMNLPKSGG